MSDNGNYTPDIITTEDEEGKIHQFEKIDELEVEGQKYALLIYLGSGDSLETIEKEDDGDEDEDGEGHDEEVVVMKVTMEDGAEVFEAIEDEDEFEKVVQYIESLEEVDEDEEE